MDKLLLEDYDKHPRLKTIKIKLNENEYLAEFAALLVHFQDNYNELFAQRKEYLNQFEYYEIKANHLKINRNEKTQSSHAVFKGTKNKTYSIDATVVETSPNKD